VIWLPVPIHFVENFNPLSAKLECEHGEPFHLAGIACV
jgi:hypothetical protein